MHNEIFYTKKYIKEFKIGIISDIHYYPNFKQKTFDRIINQMKENKPDYIVVIGDILDSANIEKIDRLETFFKDLANISKTFVVTGNHDEKQGKMHNWSQYSNTKLITMLNGINNLHYLQDSSFTINNITFYGFNLSYYYYEVVDEEYNSFCEEIAKLKPNFNDNNYNIILFHSPINIYRYLDNNPTSNLAKSDLILSGHMHNGCLPFIISHPLNRLFKSSRGLIGPDRKLFPKHAQGRIYERDGYIYEGITKLSYSTRFFHNFDFIFQKNVEFITIKNIQK